MTHSPNTRPGGVIYWFRNDCRLHDQPALAQAIAYANQHNTWLLPVYVHDSRHDAETRWGFVRMGQHRRHWTEAALQGLAQQLAARGSRLYGLTGETPSVLKTLYDQLQASVVYCEDIQAPEELTDVHALRDAGVNVNTVWQSTLIAPEDLPFAPNQMPDTFTVFRQAIERARVKAAKPLPAPEMLPPRPDLTALAESTGMGTTLCLEDKLASTVVQPNDRFTSENLNAIGKPISSTDFNSPPDHSAFPYHHPDFNGSEQAALAHLKRYCERGLPHTYKTTRNGLIGADYSSKWSPWLATGALSARQAWAAIQAFEAEHGANDSTYWLWFELLWRDYFRWLHHKYGVQLYHARGLSSHPTPAHNARAFDCWCHAQTGHPFIDAGLNELTQSGYVSNRIRQNMASFLIHDLACDWRAGAAWFEANLIDYDVYSNQGNWLYLSSRGTDPRGSRRFNPDKQAHDYDKNGAYRTLWAR